MFRKKMFPGGMHPHEGINGKSVNSGNAICELPAPQRVIIPLSQHIGAPATALVKKGDAVLMGQKIGEAAGYVSAPVHASVSGKVVGIENVEVASGAVVPAVVIENDYQDTWVELKPAAHPETLSAEALQGIIREAGIVGLGGATFPTSVKLTPAKGKTIEKLIINGAECEPYLTADHRLMLEKPAQIIDGIRLVMLALDIREAIIGVEDNKMDAIAALRAACASLEHNQSDKDIKVHEMPSKSAEPIQVKSLPVMYPQGGEKQLVYAITRRKVPAGGLPIDVGCVVCNVGTIYAVQQAIREGKPLIERVATMGGLVNNPGNFLFRIGTPVEHMIDACGGLQPNVVKLISGGPMMGAALPHAKIPMTKGTSGILALGKEALEKPENPCINCGRCVNACPMRLVPTKLDLLVRAGNYEDAEKQGVLNCMECGACTFACPAKRLLTQSCRTGKRIINAQKKAAAAKVAAEATKE